MQNDWIEICIESNPGNFFHVSTKWNPISSSLCRVLVMKLILIFKQYVIFRWLVPMTPIIAFERLFFAVFGQTSPDDINSQRQSRPEWTENLFKLVYGIYMLVSVIVLINLLIAMMSDTYQRIQVIIYSLPFISFHHDPNLEMNPKNHHPTPRA